MPSEYDSLLAEPPVDQKSPYDALLPAPVASAPSGYVGRGEFAPEAAVAPIVSSQPQDTLAQITKNASDAALDVAKGIPQMVASLPRYAYEGLRFAAGGPQEKAGVIERALGEAIPQGQQLAKDVQSPLGSRESFRGLAQLGLMAAPALSETLLGRTQPEIPPIQTAPSLTESLFGKEPSLVSQPTEATTAQPLTESLFGKQQGEPNASQIPSTESVPVPEVRQEMGGEPPLRQQGETTGARQGNTEQVAGQQAAQESVVPRGFVRLYHGGGEAAGEAGRDFTTSKQYAEDYAAKAEADGQGKATVWSVDVPEGSLKTHDETGQPMTRVVVPDEVRKQASPVSEGGAGTQALISKESSVETPPTVSETTTGGQATTIEQPEAGQLFAPSEIPFNLGGEEPPLEIGKEGAARAKAEATYAQEKAQTQLFEPELSKEEQARVQSEYEQSLIDEYHQHAERGGEELLDAVKSSGKLPALSHPQVQQFSGELKNIREAYKGPRTERIKYADIFSKAAVDIDELTQNLKAKGFDVETPADTLALVEDRIRTGKPLYGSEARGQALADQSFQYGMGAAASKEPLPGQTVTPGVRATGISQALHERRAGGQIDTGEGVSAERMVTRGRELLQHGYDPDAIVDYVTQGGAVTGDEMAVLRAHIENLSKATNRAQDLADANPSDIQLQRNAETAFQNEAEWRQKIKPAATEWHKAGQAMQGETDIDTGTFTGLRRAFLEVKGRDATPGEQAKLTDLADKTQKADAAVSEVKSRYDEVVKKETANLPPISPDQLAFGENFGVGVNPKSEITDLTRIIWKVAKDGYIDKGVTSLDDTIHGVALDTGLTSDVVRDALTKPKAIRQITNEMYAKMAARRNMVNAAKDYINAKDEPQWKRVIKAVWETPFSLAIYGHGTVGGLTHAGANIFRPSVWSAYWPDFVNQVKFFARPGIHEAAMQRLVRDPNFITGKRAGLANDPNLTYTDYGAYAKFFGLQGGRRGFDALKTMRQSMFNAYWDKVPDSVKSDPAAAKEMAKGYADIVNHATGVISNSDRGFLATAARAGSPIAFAAKLEASRWARVIGDPVKTSDTFTRWNQATPAEKSVAIQRTKNAAEFAAMFVGSLYLNQAILSASGSKEKINFNDPSRSDWLKHKIARHDVAVDGGLLAPIRLLGRLAYDTLVRPRQELRGDTRTTAAIKDIGNYAMGKASPSVSIAKEAVTAESFDGRLLPWSRDTSKKPKMTWTEYATSHGPIPLSGATKEIYDSMRERGMSSPDAKSYLRGLAAFGSELTGARVTPSREERAPTVKSRGTKQKSGQSIPAGKTP